jgi:4-hydroxy-4-methyl-2-oxoglutarate aldolase
MNQLGIVKRNIVRADKAAVEKLSQFGVATIHEAMGRVGLMKTYMRPVYSGAKICGTAVTILLQPGDVAVAACTTDNEDGFFGDLLATSFQARGAKGLIIDGGVRDVAELERMNFPVFSKAIISKGTIKATLGSVNIQVVCAGAIVNPGDVVVADVDGIVVVSAAIAHRGKGGNGQRDKGANCGHGELLGCCRSWTDRSRSGKQEGRHQKGGMDRR